MTGKFKIEFEGDVVDDANLLRSVVGHAKMTCALYEIYNEARGVLKHGEHEDYEDCLDRIKDLSWFVTEEME